MPNASERLTSIDDPLYIDVCRYEELVMLKLFKRTRELAVEFCERCGSVCDAACRRNAIIDRARDRALLQGMRVS
jgi:MinD superfamily P-loop ATPase